MKTERYKTPTASHLFLIRDTDDGRTEVLLQKRGKTWKEGWWDASASGHVDEGECMTASIIREAKEEICVTVKKEDFTYTLCIHACYAKSGGDTYHEGFFFAKVWQGEPQVGEAEKIAEIKWFDINDLPEQMLPDRRQAIENFKQGIHYSEYGWD